MKSRTVSVSEFAEALEKTGISQTDLAKCTGISSSQLSRYKTRGIFPTSQYSHVAKIAKALGVPPDDILEPEGETP